MLTDHITEWHDWTVPPWRRWFGMKPITTINGTPLTGLYVMRRRVRGEWQYREPTLQELWDIQSKYAW